MPVAQALGRTRWKIQPGGGNLFQNSGVLLRRLGLLQGLPRFPSADLSQGPRGVASYQKLTVVQSQGQGWYGGNLSAVAQGDTSIPL